MSEQPQDAEMLVLELVPSQSTRCIYSHEGSCINVEMAVKLEEALETKSHENLAIS